MKTAIAQSLLHFAILSVFFLLACRQIKRVPVKELGLFLLIIILDYIILLKVPQPAFMNGLSHNWHSKILETILALLFIFIYRKISLKEYGFTAKIESGSLKPIILVFLLIAVLVNGFLYISKGFAGSNTETLLFEATMPGIAEELIFRGVLLALLNSAFGKPWKIFGTNMGWAVIIVSLLYGLLHGLTVDGNLKLQFDPAKIIITGLIGFALAWAKEKSGSLIPGIAAHNLINFAGSF
jgi:uncharacterized protein